MSANEPRETFRFTVMGPVRGWRGSTELVLGPPQQRAVLAFLLLRLGQPVTIEQLGELLWGQHRPVTWTNVIHRQIGRLRHILEPGLPARANGSLLLRCVGGYKLVLADTDSVDVLRFRALVDEARKAGPTEALRRYEEAFSLREGPAGTGVSPEALLHQVFTAVDREFVSVLGEAADLALRTPETANRLLVILRQAAAQHPLEESLQARLVRTLGRAGHQGEALEVFQRARIRLADELGVDPGRELRDAQADVLRRHVQYAVDDATGKTAEATAPPPAAGAGRPRQLPGDLLTFVGRKRELDYADALVGHVGEQSSGIVVCAVSGMAGIGKSAFAVRWAHRMAGHFPDGQLYVNLHSSDDDPAGVTEPGEALRGFLLALGHAAGDLPPTLADRTALFRSTTRDLRLLIVVDDARDSRHVRPLLPSGPGCMVVVTSRDRLSGLVTVDGAHHIGLDVPDADEARDLLVRRLGPERAMSEPEAVEEIVACSARHPLALATVAARAAVHPAFPLSAIAADLRRSRDRLDGFAGGDAGADIRAAFAVSYRTLNPDAARLFRLLTTYPGRHISERAAASLSGHPLAEVRPLLAELVAGNMLTEHAHRRFSFPDLLRVFADELCREVDPESERHDALRRTFDHYLHSAWSGYRPGPAGESPDRIPPQVCTEEFPDTDALETWFGAERAMLLTIISHVSGLYLSGRGWELSRAREHFFDRDGRWHDVAVTHRPVVPEPRSAGSTVAALRGVTDGRRPGTLSRAAIPAQRYEDELRDALRQASASRPGAAVVNDIGWYYSALGDFGEALRHGHWALVLAHSGGNRYSEAAAWDNIGYASFHLGLPQEAVSSYRRALALYDELGTADAQADTLVRLGEIHSSAGDSLAAGRAWAHALRIMTGPARQRRDSGQPA